MTTVDGPDVEVEIEAAAWTDALPAAVDVASRAARLALGDVQRGVVILLTDNETVRDLNDRFRGKDTATNVLAFPAAAGEWAAATDSPPPSLGDIALAYGVCAGEAVAQCKALGDHLSHLVIHGVLHLLGHDHDSDSEAEAMETVERELLSRLGVADPYAAAPGTTVERDLPHHV